MLLQEIVEPMIVVFPHRRSSPKRQLVKRTKVARLVDSRISKRNNVHLKSFSVNVAIASRLL